MDDDGLNMRNWGYYEPSFKEYLGLQLLSPLGDHRDSKPVMINQNGSATAVAAASYHHQPFIPSHYMRDSWIHRDRLLHMLPGNPSFDLVPNTSASNSAHLMHPIEPDPGLNLDNDNDNDNENDNDVGGDAGGSGPPKKRSRSVATTAPKTDKKPKPKPKKVKQNGNQTGQRTKVMKWNLDMVIDGIDMDMSDIPIPVCSCTGTPQPCYRWGSGGWQSACCTTTISMYPLPMSTKRHGARIAGRKMSQGAFKKVLEKLASDGYNFANAIDLKTHWAKHGTNKFVTIR